MVTINVKEVVLTIEEAKELYSQLDDMFGPKMAYKKPTTPFELMTTEEFNLRAQRGGHL
jgi:hypothetical protein